MSEILAISTFDTTTEGWSPIGATQIWDPFGNPNGSLKNHDTTDVIALGFKASSVFLGNKSAAFGGTLSWDINPSGNNNGTSTEHLYLDGNGVTISVALAPPKIQEWTGYEVKLDATTGWVNTASSTKATDDQILSVLSNLTQLVIDGEFVSGFEFTYLDNVILRASDPSLSIKDVAITEGNQGHKNAVFQVQMSRAFDEKVTVKYSTIKGSAKSPSDYTSKNGTITFNPNQTKQTIVIPIKGDTLLEGNETFSVKLSNATFADIADGIGKATILNDDVAPPKLSINNVSLFEGNNGTTTAKFTVTLKGKAVEAVKVLYSTDNKTASSGSDFSPKAGSLTFKASNKTQQKQTISVAIKGDKKVENNEIFFVNLSSATNGVINDSRGVGTIKNDDNNNLFPQNEGLLGRISGLDFSRYQELIGSERSSLTTPLYQSTTSEGLVSSINSFVNTEAVVI